MVGVSGQRVRMTISNTGAPGWLTLSEFKGWGSSQTTPTNITAMASASNSTPGFGTTVADAIDNGLGSNYNAVSGDRPIFHDAAAARQGSYCLDYPADIDFYQVQLFNRVAGGAVATTKEYRVSILDEFGFVLASQLVAAEATDYDHVLDFTGTSGRTVLVEESNPGQFSAFSEVRVYGVSVPEPGSAVFALLGGLLVFRRRR